MTSSKAERIASPAISIATIRCQRPAGHMKGCTQLHCYRLWRRTCGLVWNIGTIFGKQPKNRGKQPKMDGEHNGKTYEQMDDLGGFPITVFLVQHPYFFDQDLVALFIEASIWDQPLNATTTVDPLPRLVFDFQNGVGVDPFRPSTKIRGHIQSWITWYKRLGGGFKYFLIFIPIPWGFMLQFDDERAIFFRWVVVFHQGEGLDSFWKHRGEAILQRTPSKGLLEPRRFAKKKPEDVWGLRFVVLGQVF